MPGGKPNVLITSPGELGGCQVGHCRRGVMGCFTAPIDRIAAEGVRLTDCYARANSTAVRAASLSGQLPMRTGLTAGERRGALEGLQPERPTLAEPLTPLGYATAQIGRHHLGHRKKFVPTVHGFDELPANFNHLDVAEEPATRMQLLNSVPPEAADGIATKESTAL